MSAFYFFYGITFVLVCMVAVCVSVCTYLVSHRTSYLTVSAFFFFDMLESAIVFLDEYQGRKMMADILSNQFPMTHPITKLVLSIGIMTSMWAFALAIVNKTSRLHVLVPCIAFSAFEAMSLVLQPDSIKQLTFYALRSLFMFVAFGMIFVCYRKSKPMARKSFYARYGRFLIVMAVLTAFVLIEDVCALGLNIGWTEGIDYLYFAYGRNIPENVMSVVAAIYTVRTASRILSLRFSAPPTTSGASAKQIAELRFSAFCDQRGISAREREVLDLLLDGQDNRAIANDLFISVGTVKSHVHTIFRKCGVSSRSELLQSFWAG